MLNMNFKDYMMKNSKTFVITALYSDINNKFVLRLESKDKLNSFIASQHIAKTIDDRFHIPFKELYFVIDKILNGEKECCVYESNYDTYMISAFESLSSHVIDSPPYYKTMNVDNLISFNIAIVNDNIVMGRNIFSSTSYCYEIAQEIIKLREKELNTKLVMDDVSKIIKDVKFFEFIGKDEYKYEGVQVRKEKVIDLIQIEKIEFLLKLS